MGSRGLWGKGAQVGLVFPSISVSGWKGTTLLSHMDCFMVQGPC